VADGADQGSLLTRARLWQLNAQELLAMYPPKVLRHTIDSRGSAAEVVAQCSALVDSVCN
jgi:hypothetical protein